MAMTKVLFKLSESIGGQINRHMCTEYRIDPTICAHSAFR